MPNAPRRKFTNNNLWYEAHEGAFRRHDWRRAHTPLFEDSEPQQVTDHKLYKYVILLSGAAWLRSRGDTNAPPLYGLVLEEFASLIQPRCTNAPQQGGLA